MLRISEKEKELLCGSCFSGFQNQPFSNVQSESFLFNLALKSVKSRKNKKTAKNA